MREILKLSDKEFKITINRLNILIEKVNKIQDQTVNFSKENETIRNDQMEMREIKNMAIKMKNAFNSFISRLDTAEEKKSLNLKIDL